MALPHLKPSIYTTRKQIYEASIVHRRNHEDHYREKWEGTAKYFHTEDVKATKQSAWESEQSFNNSMEAWRMKQMKENKAENLARRRKKLADLLEKERLEHTAALKGMSGDSSARLEGMRERSEELRSAREERRKQLAEEKMYEHWRVNSPDLRQVEREMHKQHVISAWSEQEKERKERERQENEKIAAEEKRSDEQRKLAVEREREREEEKLRQEKELQNVLKEQMEELRKRESDANRLKEEQDRLLKEQWELEQIESERKNVEAERQQQEFGKILLRQHAAALRRKSKQIVEELEQDQKWLDQLIAAEARDVRAQEERRERARADARWMRQVLADQIKVEKQREAELDLFYQDEAARVWQQREAEWAREREARQRLMQEVMDERQKQIVQRMESVRLAQEESLERREELLRDLELANQMTRRQERDKEAAVVERRKEIDSQVAAERKAQEEGLRLDLQQLREEQREEQRYGELLQREADHMTVRGFQPREFGRKQAWT